MKVHVLITKVNVIPKVFLIIKKEFAAKKYFQVQTANGPIKDFKDILEGERLFYLSLNASRDNKYFPCEFINNVN